MSKNASKDSRVDRWLQLESYLKLNIPHVIAWCNRVDEFNELRFKSRDDGTVLAIAKGYGSDGSPVVLFGSGYSYTLALVAIDSAIQGGEWRLDKPWSPNGQGK